MNWNNQFSFGCDQNYDDVHCGKQKKLLTKCDRLQEQTAGKWTYYELRAYDTLTHKRTQGSNKSENISVVETGPDE